MRDRVNIIDDMLMSDVEVEEDTWWHLPSVILGSEGT